MPARAARRRAATSVTNDAASSGWPAQDQVVMAGPEQPGRTALAEPAHHHDLRRLRHLCYPAQRPACLARSSSHLRRWPFSAPDITRRPAKDRVPTASGPAARHGRTRSSRRCPGQRRALTVAAPPGSRRLLSAGQPGGPASAGTNWPQFGPSARSFARPRARAFLASECTSVAALACRSG